MQRILQRHRPLSVLRRLRVRYFDGCGGVRPSPRLLSRSGNRSLAWRNRVRLCARDAPCQRDTAGVGNLLCDSNLRPALSRRSGSLFRHVVLRVTRKRPFLFHSPLLYRGPALRVRYFLRRPGLKNGGRSRTNPGRLMERTRNDTGKVVVHIPSSSRYARRRTGDRARMSASAHP
jgi:hypothetical protein